MRQAACELGPGVAAVGAFVDAPFQRATDDSPWLTLPVPHGSEDHARAAGLKFQIGGTQGVGNIEDLLPGLAAIGGAIDAALFVGNEWISSDCHEHDIGIGGMDAA